MAASTSDLLPCCTARERKPDAWTRVIDTRIVLGQAAVFAREQPVGGICYIARESQQSHESHGSHESHSHKSHPVPTTPPCDSLLPQLLFSPHSHRHASFLRTLPLPAWRRRRRSQQQHNLRQRSAQPPRSTPSHYCCCCWEHHHPALRLCPQLRRCFRL